jgi:hydrogenase nickel incorporation protein HypA/HybF
MHELTLADALLQQIERLARENGAPRVLRAELRVGPLAGVDADALRAAFVVIAEGTVAGGCALEIVAPRAQVHCAACGCRTDLAAPWAACARCGSSDVTLEGGRDLLLCGIEIPDQAGSESDP